MEKQEVKRKYDEILNLLNELMDMIDEGESLKDDSRWRVAGDFDFSIPELYGKEAEFIPELNEFNDIAEALENGEKFSVPFATEEILKLAMATENSFWIANVCVDPVEGSDNVFDWGFELRDWNGKVVNELFFSDYVPTEVYLLTEGVPFGQIAEDINAFVEGFTK